MQNIPTIRLAPTHPIRHPPTQGSHYTDAPTPVIIRGVDDVDGQQPAQPKPQNQHQQTGFIIGSSSPAKKSKAPPPQRAPASPLASTSPWPRPDLEFPGKAAASDHADAAEEAPSDYGIGHRLLPDDTRLADKPVGGEVEAGYGIGNRVLPAGTRLAHKPVGGEVEAGFGIGNRVLPDYTRLAHKPVGGGVEAGFGIGNRALPDYTRLAHKPVGGEVEAGFGIGNRALPDDTRLAHKPVGGEVEAGFGIGNRVLADDTRLAHKPVGGEVEAGYGINKRVLPDDTRSVWEGLTTVPSRSIHPTSPH